MAGNYEPQRHWTVTPRERQTERGKKETEACRKIKQINETWRNMNKLTDSKTENGRGIIYSKL